MYNQTDRQVAAHSSWYEFRLELFERFLGHEASLDPASTVENAARLIRPACRTAAMLYENNARSRRKGSLSSAYIQGFARALRAFASWLHARRGYSEHQRPQTPQATR